MGESPKCPHCGFVIGGVTGEIENCPICGNRYNNKVNNTNSKISSNITSSDTPSKNIKNENQENICELCNKNVGNPYYFHYGKHTKSMSGLEGPRRETIHITHEGVGSSIICDECYHKLRNKNLKILGVGWGIALLCLVLSAFIPELIIFLIFLCMLIFTIVFGLFFLLIKNYLGDNEALRIKQPALFSQGYNYFEPDCSLTYFKDYKVKK